MANGIPEKYRNQHTKKVKSIKLNAMSKFAFIRLLNMFGKITEITAIQI